MIRLRTLCGALALLAWSSAASAQPAPAQLIPPAALDHADAPYPASEVDGGKEATVILNVTVGTDGTVSDPEVFESAGKAFDDAALAAVKTWVFSPAQKNGKPVRARIRVPFHFVPPPKPAPSPVAPPAPPKAEAPKPEAPKAPDAAPAIPEAPKTPSDAAPNPADQGVEVDVVGHAPPPSRGAADYHVEVGKLAEVPRKNASELLHLAPGILLQNEGGEGHAEQVFLRGFDAREGQDIEFTAGGVPINESGNLHGNGYADTHFVMPELVSSLRVVEGPFDPRQGNYAVAGSADYELGLAKRGLTAKYTIGSFNSHRLALLFGPPGASQRTFGGAEIATSDGFGQNRDSKRASAMGQYEGRLGAEGTWRVGASAYATTYHSAGVLREDDYEKGVKGFYDTYDPLQGGDGTRLSAWGEVETRAGDFTLKQLVFVIDRGMRLRENFTGFLLDVQTSLQNPHGQRGDLLDLDVSEQTVGLRGSARLKGKAIGEDQEIEIGYFARGDHVDGTQYRVEAATGHPYKLETSLESKLADLGLYADLGIKPTRWLTLRGGARGDLFAYDVLDRCAVQSVSHPSKTNPPGDASCLSQQDFGLYREPVQRASTGTAAFLPRATVLLGPIRRFTFSASVGKGVRSVDPSYVSQDVKTPFAAVLAYEGGVAYAGELGDFALIARSSFFQTKVDKDLLFSETAGRNLLGGGTTRTGWAVSGRATGDHVDVSANATFVKSTFDDTGLLVPYIPDVVARGDGAVFGRLPVQARGEAFVGTLSTGMTFVDRRPLPFGQRSDAIFTVDASATLGWTHYELGLTITNLFDTRYREGEYNFVSDFHSEPSPTLVPVRHFAAGAPRGIYGTFSINLGGA